MSFKYFIGIVVSILAIAATLAVAVYWIAIVWIPTPIPATAVTNYIPPAAYALVLYVIWSSLQRIQAHQRPPGNGWWWADLLPSLALALFLGATFGIAIYKGFDNLTVVAAGSFFGGSVVDFINNGRHLYDKGNYVPGTGTPSEELLHQLLSGDQTAIGPFKVRPKVIIEPEYVVLQPDGSERPVTLTQIAGATN